MEFWSVSRKDGITGAHKNIDESLVLCYKRQTQKTICCIIPCI